MREHSWNTAVARQLPSPIIEQDVFRKKQSQGLPKGVPIGEKVLYLLSVIICVSLALVVIAKHARVTELNLSIRNIETQIHDTNKLNLQLEAQKEQRSSIEAIRNFAEEKGLELSLPKILPS